MKVHHGSHTISINRGSSPEIKRKILNTLQKTMFNLSLAHLFFWFHWRGSHLKYYIFSSSHITAVGIRTGYRALVFHARCEKRRFDSGKSTPMAKVTTAPNIAAKKTNKGTGAICSGQGFPGKVITMAPARTHAAASHW